MAWGRQAGRQPWGRQAGRRTQKVVELDRPGLVAPDGDVGVPARVRVDKDVELILGVFNVEGLQKSFEIILDSRLGTYTAHRLEVAQTAQAYYTI